jgi:transposase
MFRRTWLLQPALLEQAMGRQALALLVQLEAAVHVEEDRAEVTRALFRQHPDAAILTSFLGLGELAGARLLAEIGDDRRRFAAARRPPPAGR